MPAYNPAHGEIPVWPVWKDYPLMNSIEDEFYNRFSARAFVLKWMLGIGVVLFTASLYWVMIEIWTTVSFHVGPEYIIYGICMIAIAYLVGSILYDHLFLDRR